MCNQGDDREDNCGKEVNVGGEADAVCEEAMRLIAATMKAQCMAEASGEGDTPNTNDPTGTNDACSLIDVIHCAEDLASKAETCLEQQTLTYMQKALLNKIVCDIQNYCNALEDTILEPTSDTTASASTTIPLSN